MFIMKDLSVIDGLPVIIVTSKTLEKLGEFTKKYTDNGSGFIVAVDMTDLGQNQRMHPLLNSFHDVALKGKNYEVSTAKDVPNDLFLVKYLPL